MFGSRYFGRRFFAGRYFGAGSSAPAVVAIAFRRKRRRAIAHWRL